MKAKPTPTKLEFDGQYAPLKPAIICDLDGTLCLLDGRNPYDATDCFYDKLNHPVYRLLMKYHKEGYALLFITGRSEEHQESTLAWLIKNGISPTILIMRTAGNKEKDTEMKKAAYLRHVIGTYDVEFVLEDRNRVVDMWRSLGLTCFQVAPGNF